MEEVPRVYFYSNENIKNIIIHLGCGLFEKLKLNELSDEEIISKYHSICEKDRNIEEPLNKIKEKMRLMNEEHNEEVERYRKKQMELNDEMEYRVQCGIKQNIERNNKELELIRGYNSELRQELDNKKESDERWKKIEERIIDKTDFKNPTEKGTHIEKIFDKIYNDEGVEYVDKSICIDTSEEGGSGDRILKLDDFVLMIEVKNKKVIKTNPDITVFEKHYEKDLKENKVDCALFFSYNTTQIPGKPDSLIPYYEKENVIYYGLKDGLTPDEKEERIKWVIKEIYLKYKNKKKEIEKNIEVETNYSEIYNKRLLEINDMKTMFTKKNKILKEENQFYNNQIEKINKEVITKIRESLEKGININYALVDKNEYKEQFINKILNWMNTSENGKKKKWKDSFRNENDLSETELELLPNIKIKK